MKNCIMYFLSISKYAFLKETYLSYWFTKYTNLLLCHLVHFETIHE